MLYKQMSEPDRTKLQDDIKAVLDASIAEAEKRVRETTGKLVAEVFNEVLVVNPIGALIRQHGGEYEVLEALEESVFDAICHQTPSAFWISRSRDLLSAWKEQFPADLRGMLNDALEAENKSLRDTVESLELALKLQRNF